MARVVWSREALASLDLIAAYIALFDSAAAARTRNRLLQAGQDLRDFPDRGRPAVNGTRELVTVRPYVLRYERSAELVTILRIRHAAQLSDPD